MQVSKKWVTAAAACVAGCAYAGGQEEALVAPALPNSGIYLEANLGYASRDWGHVINFPADVDVSNRQGGFTGGVAGGYEFTDMWSVEAGWMHLSTTQIKRDQTVLDEITSWFFYTVAKISVPINLQASVFAKLGVSYTHNTNSPSSGSIFNATESEYWGGYFAMGAQYYFNQNVSFNAQFAYLPGLQVAVTSPTKFATPNACLYTLGIGYKFIL